LQSLIRTAEQLKIKGLCEINEHTATTNTESDQEAIYPPHKKSRASRHYDRHHGQKDAQQPVAQPQETVKRKSKSPIKETAAAAAAKSLSPGSQNQSRNMASLEMGMVSINSKFHKCLIASFVDVVVVLSLFPLPTLRAFSIFMCAEYIFACTERKCCDSTGVHGFRPRTTGTHCNARHYNRSKLHTEPRYKRSVK
jgi:hypothetical protein